ncbi:MAG: hypothetical protein IT335_07140 [Thermomicrobiales bacterium]|nr:hypothetical protein [Thermomicrobiales bacterium]
MESRKFDALTRAMAEGASRRSVIKGLFGGAVAMAGTAVATRGIGAQECLDPPDDICAGGGGDNPDGCSCNGGAGVCTGGWCIDPATLCGDTSCGGNPDCQQCIEEQCTLVNQGGSCNGGAGICEGEWCVDPPECPSSDGACTNGGGTIPDGCECNGGAGVCAGGWCCNPSQLCGESCCSGNPDCEYCNEGVCTTYNQGGSCNGGAGICENEWCVDPPTCPEYEGNSCTAAGGTIPDGCPCGEDAYCHIGWCAHEWQICGNEICEGDSECIVCVGEHCELINQYGSCNDGAGVCCGQYCVDPEDELCCPDGGCDECHYCYAGMCSPICGEGLSCCPDGDYTYCADLYSDHWDCGACGYSCNSCEVCWNGYCVETEECCGGIGDSCGYPIGPASEGSDQLSCCDGLVCCNPDNAGDDDDDDDDDDWGGSYCAECCTNWDCPKGEYCKHGRCKKKHHHHKPPHKPGKPGKAPEIDTLPNTGSGDTAGNSGAWLGAAALGAAAYFAGKTLRSETVQTEADSVSE